MSKRLELHPDEQMIYRTASAPLARFMLYFVGIFLLPLFGLGFWFLFGWGFGIYSDVVITSRRLMLKKSGLFRNRGGHRSIPLDQIYLADVAEFSVTQGTAQGWGTGGGFIATGTAVTQNVQVIELDLVNGKTLKMRVARPNVFMARFHEATNFASSPQ